MRLSRLGSAELHRDLGPFATDLPAFGRWALTLPVAAVTPPALATLPTLQPARRIAFFAAFSFRLLSFGTLHRTGAGEDFGSTALVPPAARPPVPADAGAA
jgi:hypothetical protein